MTARNLLGGRGIRQITSGLGTLDREVFEAVAESPSVLLDRSMPVLTRAADHSKLWFAIAAALVAIAPLLLMFLFLQRWIVEGVERTGMGGD
mgnify:CR=1 FL=1